MRREETTYKVLMRKYASWSVEIPEIWSDRIDLGSGLIPYDAEPDESRESRDPAARDPAVQIEGSGDDLP